MKFSENWLTLVSVLFLGICLTASSVYGQRSECEHNAVTLAEPFFNCSRKYFRCEGGQWRRAMCVGGVVSSNNGECVPFTPECPDPGLKDKFYASRTKRQVSTTATDCSRAYACPSDLTSIFVYPDWENTECDTYVVCFAGERLRTSCRNDGYNYYNPRRLSCEEFASASNTCVNREFTDLSPLF